MANEDFVSVPFRGIKNQKVRLIDIQRIGYAQMFQSPFGESKIRKWSGRCISVVKYDVSVPFRGIKNQKVPIIQSPMKMVSWFQSPFGESKIRKWIPATNGKYV